MIFTSATLQDKGKTEKTLGIKFQADKEFFLDYPDRLFLTVLSEVNEYKNPDGKSNTQLYFNKEGQLNEEQLISYGNEIQKYIEIIPNGILICFPNYEMLQKAQKLWKNNFKQRIFTESRDKSQLQKQYEEFKSEAQSQKGALLFIVFRGNYSEGFDFKDTLCRGIFIAGLPYPNLKDVKLMQKEKLFGHQKYWEEVYQEVQGLIEQAIGRVRRHSLDYGCVFLCDWRYNRYKGYHYKGYNWWFHPHYLRQFSSKIQQMKKLKIFFKNEGQVFWMPEYQDDILEQWVKSDKVKKIQSQELKKYKITHSCELSRDGECIRCNQNLARRKPPKNQCLKHGKYLNSNNQCWQCQQNLRAKVKTKLAKRKITNRKFQIDCMKKVKFTNDQSKYQTPKRQRDKKFKDISVEKQRQGIKISKRAFTNITFQNNIFINNNISVNPPRCLKCQSTQHVTYECKILKKCVNCKEEGHYAKGCPYYHVQTQQENGKEWENPSERYAGNRLFKMN